MNIQIGDKFKYVGNKKEQVVTINSLIPFRYRWCNGADGMWSRDTFEHEVERGSFVKLVPPMAPPQQPLKLHPASSADILRKCVEVQQERGKQRDSDTGERSMKRTVDAFNAAFGKDLTETEGWMFMVCLKMARSVNGDFQLDDYIDGTSYFALAGESAAKEA